MDELTEDKNLDIVKENEKKKKRKLSYIDKLFIRIFLSSLVLLSLCLNTNHYIKQLLNKEINFLSYTKLIYGIFDEEIFKNDITVSNNNFYDNVIFNTATKENEIHNYSSNIVHALIEGVVTKIYKDKSGLYDIYILTKDNTSYIYKGLESIDVSIYSYITYGKIIGAASLDHELQHYSFNLIIKKEGKYLDYYETITN